MPTQSNKSQAVAYTTAVCLATFSGGVATFGLTKYFPAQWRPCS